MRIARFLPIVAAAVTLGSGSPAPTAPPAPLPPLPGTGVLRAPADPEKFSFVVMGDNRPATPGTGQTETVGKIFEAARARHADFVLSTGNTIFGHDPGHPALIEKEYAEYLLLAKKAGVPVFNAPGNHESDDSTDVPAEVMQQLYQKFMGPLYGAFDYGNSHFIALDTEEIAFSPLGLSRRAIPPSGPSLDPGYVGPEQLSWLKRDLDASRAKAHVFVFMHHSIKARDKSFALDGGSAYALEEIFKGRRNLSYILASHEHLYYNPLGRTGIEPPPSRTDPSPEPPVYLVTGGAGAPLSGKPEEGGFFHYLVVHVDGSRVSAELVRLPSGGNK